MFLDGFIPWMPGRLGSSTEAHRLLLHELTVGGSLGLKAQLVLCRNMIQELKICPLVLGQKWLESPTAG